MINVDLYVNIVNKKEIINFIIYFCFACTMINLTISFITDILKKTQRDISNNSNDKSKYGILELFGGIFIIFLIFVIHGYSKLTKFISIFYIPSIILLFYVIYIRPMIRDYPSIFKYDYYEYGGVVTFALFYFTNIDYKKIFIGISSETMIQVLCIIILLFEIYSCIYCLLLNTYFVIKNLKKINISKFLNKLIAFFNMICKKLDFASIRLEFLSSKKLIENKKMNIILKIVLFLPNFILDTITCFLKYVCSAIFCFTINPISKIFGFIFSNLIKLSRTNENQINYGITKMVSTFTIVLVFVIIQMNEIFQERIVSTYEFISSVIIIPVVLESLLTLKAKMENND